jgi:hypothetical protein
LAGRSAAGGWTRSRSLSRSSSRGDVLVLAERVVQDALDQAVRSRKPLYEVLPDSAVTLGGGSV